MAKSASQPAWAPGAAAAVISASKPRSPGNAFNEHDAAAIADRFLEEGQLIGSTGITVGKAAMKEQYEGNFERNPEIKSTASLDSVRFLNPDVAIALMRGTVTGQAEPSPWKFLATFVLVKRGGEWKTALAQFVGSRAVS